MRFLLALLACLVLAAPAHAQTGVAAETAAALVQDNVYVDPSAEAALTSPEADALRRAIGDADAGPVYVAVLPASALGQAGGSPDQLLRDVAAETRRDGTYVLVAGEKLRAGSTTIGGVAGVADAAVREHPGDLPAILQAFVADLGSGAPGAGGGDGGDGTGLLVLVGAMALGGGALTLSSRRRRRKQEAAELDEVKDQVRDELVELGEGIRALDLDVEMPDADRAGKEDYGRAVAAYDRANLAWSTARRVLDLAPVGAALEEGRWALQSARARLEGREPPERRAPCFFDPRHGPSAREVEWAPPGGAPREVPACEADAQRVERGLDPGFREVAVGGSMVPYWAAGPAFSPFYAGGMFGGFGFGGGLLGGLMLGSLLSPGMAWGAGDGFGGGDFGGFGGGDFGGGDFGDFGGGDF